MKKLSILIATILIPVGLMADGYYVPSSKAPEKPYTVELLNLRHDKINMSNEIIDLKKDRDHLQAVINGLRVEATTLGAKYNKLWVENTRLKNLRLEVAEKVILKEVEKETTPWWVWPVVVVALII